MALYKTTCCNENIKLYIHTHIHTYIHTYINTYIHTYINTYIHKHIHIYIHNDLASSDFYLFGRLKSDLQGMRFADDAVIHTVREWIRRQTQAFFEKGIRMLPERWKNCGDSGGEYVEDWHVQVFGNYGLKNQSRSYLNHLVTHNPWEEEGEKNV